MFIVQFLFNNHRLSGSCMVNNWSSSCSTRVSSPPPPCWCWFFLLLLLEYHVEYSEHILNNMAIWQSIYMYIGECATLQLEIFWIWKISPATPKGGVWEANQPVLPVENWSQPITNQDLIERWKKEMYDTNKFEKFCTSLPAENVFFRFSKCQKLWISSSFIQLKSGVLYTQYGI